MNTYRASPSRAAWSLIELLVVLAILAVLFGIVVSAVQRVRQTAARAECSNKLKQISLAMHQYHGVHHSFPAGVDGHRHPTQAMGWPTRCLPYLERTEIWQKSQLAYQIKPFPVLPLVTPHIETAGIVVPAFGCPLADRLSGHHPDFPEPVAFTWYVGVLGENGFQNDGVLHLDSRTAVRDIRDGTSSTLLLGERPPSPEGYYGWWYAGAGQNNSGSLGFILGVREFCQTFRLPQCERGPYNFQDGTLEGSCDVAHFWSLHPGGANFAFADGSVKFLRYEANAIMPALASRAGGEVVAVPE